MSGETGIKADKPVNNGRSQQAESSPEEAHNAGLHNADPRSEFCSRVYLAGRTYLVRIPKAVVAIEGIRGGEVLKLAVVAKESAAISPAVLPLRGDVVSLGEMAKSMGVLPESLAEAMMERPPPGYSVEEDLAVSSKKLGQIDRALSGVRSLDDAAKILKGEGIGDPFPVLRMLGYRVVMKGLDMRGASIERTEWRPA